MTNTLLILTALSLVTWFLLRRWRQTKPRASAASAPSLGSLVVDVERGLEACFHRQTEAADSLQQTREKFAAYVTTLQREKTAAEKSFESLALQQLLLVDVLEGWLSVPALPDVERATVSTVQANVLQALRAVRILPIAVPRGMPFNPERMVAIERMHADLPEGTVVCISRPGYEFRAGQGRVRVLRPVEVVVSAGPTPVTVPTPAPAVPPQPVNATATAPTANQPLLTQ